MNIKEFGVYLKELRENKDLTLTQLGDLIDYSNPYLSQIENGKRNNMPSPAILKKLSDVLEVSYTELMIKAGHWDTVDTNEIIKERYQKQNNIAEEKAVIGNYFYELHSMKSRISALQKVLTNSNSDRDKDEANKELIILLEKFGDTEKSMLEQINMINTSIVDVKELNEVLEKAIERDVAIDVQNFLDGTFEELETKIDLTEVLNSNQNIYFEKRLLTPYQRQQLLNIAEIIFNVENEENNEE